MQSSELRLNLFTILMLGQQVLLEK